MARRTRQSSAEDFKNLVAKLPWWAGVALALVFYVGLHQLSRGPRHLLGQVAFYGQFILPALCLLAAFVSFLRRRKRPSLVERVMQSSGAAVLNGVSWGEFGLLVGEAFRMQGYKVMEPGDVQPDGGVDLTLRKRGETFLVQCKQWKAHKVGVDAVRELHGVMVARGATGGFIVTSGRFTYEARAFTDGRNIMLVEGPELFGLIREATASLAAAAVAAAGPSSRPRSPESVPARVAATPLCPVCASSMVRRTAKKGGTAGLQFWGCAKYPVCRGMR